MKFKKKLLSLGLVVSLTIASTSISVNALDKIDTVEGADKYETAGLIADKQSYTSAILINADIAMADGLSASGLAGSTNSPILLTKKNSIPNATLKRVEKVKKVYIIGGESSIDKSTETVLKDKGIEVKRLQGSDRIKTSYNVAKEINSINKVNKVILTNAFKGEPDAMSVAPVAVRDKAAIVLTDGKSIPFNTTGVESYAIGGNLSMSNKLVSDTNSIRLGGTDRYDTNKKIINKFYNGVKEFYIASGTDLVYALIGSTVAQKTPIVLVDKNSNKEILKNAEKITAVGYVSSDVIKQSLNAANNVISENEKINKAREIIYKVTGDNKKNVLYEINTEGSYVEEQYIKNNFYIFNVIDAEAGDMSDYNMIVNKNNFRVYSYEPGGEVQEIFADKSVKITREKALDIFIKNFGVNDGSEYLPVNPNTFYLHNYSLKMKLDESDNKFYISSQVNYGEEVPYYSFTPTLSHIEYDKNGNKTIERDGASGVHIYINAINGDFYIY